jgi:hypothetical protein
MYGGLWLSRIGIVSAHSGVVKHHESYGAPNRSVQGNIFVDHKNISMPSVVIFLVVVVVVNCFLGNQIYVGPVGKTDLGVYTPLPSLTMK